jgi:hypothetical protein
MLPPAGVKAGEVQTGGDARVLTLTLPSSLLPMAAGRLVTCDYMLTVVLEVREWRVLGRGSSIQFAGLYCPDSGSGLTIPPSWHPVLYIAVICSASATSHGTSPLPITPFSSLSVSAAPGFASLPHFFLTAGRGTDHQRTCSCSYLDLPCKSCPVRTTATLKGLLMSDCLRCSCTSCLS